MSVRIRKSIVLFSFVFRLPPTLFRFHLVLVPPPRPLFPASQSFHFFTFILIICVYYLPRELLLSVSPISSESRARFYDASLFTPVRALPVSFILLQPSQPLSLPLLLLLLFLFCVTHHSIVVVVDLPACLRALSLTHTVHLGDTLCTRLRAFVVVYSTWAPSECLFFNYRQSFAVEEAGRGWWFSSFLR